MKINWMQKLTSRKFWAAAAGFVSMLLICCGKDAGIAKQVVALIMAAASLIAYMIGEGLADSGRQHVPDQPVARLSETERYGMEENNDE